MSDKADKRKPKTERLARLEGVTTYRDPRDGFSFGSAYGLTDQDVAAAIAMSRARREDGSTDSNDCGPECLETRYGSTQRHRRILVLAYMRAHDFGSDSMVEIIIRRMAATLAAQQLAGITFTRSQWMEYAYIVRTRRDSLEAAAKRALQWYEEQEGGARIRFFDALNSMAPDAEAERAAHWQEMRDAPDREDRIKSKLFRKAS